MQVSGNHRLDDNKAERQRLTELGRELSSSAVEGRPVGPLRVWPGGLAMSRTLGDHEVTTFCVRVTTFCVSASLCRSGAPKVNAVACYFCCPPPVQTCITGRALSWHMLCSPRCWYSRSASGSTCLCAQAGSAVTAEPEVRQVTLPLNGARIVIASDGLWDAVNPKTAMHHIRSMPASKAATDLVSLALSQPLVSCRLLRLLSRVLIKLTLCTAQDCHVHCSAHWAQMKQNLRSGSLASKGFRQLLPCL